MSSLVSACSGTHHTNSHHLRAAKEQQVPKLSRVSRDTHLRAAMPRKQRTKEGSALLNSAVRPPPLVEKLAPAVRSARKGITPVLPRVRVRMEVTRFVVARSQRRLCSSCGDGSCGYGSFGCAEQTRSVLRSTIHEQHGTDSTSKEDVSCQLGHCRYGENHLHTLESASHSRSPPPRFHLTPSPLSRTRLSNSGSGLTVSAPRITSSLKTLL